MWYLYDINRDEIITNKTKILNYISCPPDEPRVIPDFFEEVYKINEKILKEIEASYREIEQKKFVDTSLGEITSDRSKKFISSIIREIDLKIDSYLLDFPEDTEIERKWEETKDKLLKVSLTKKRLQELRSLWRNFKKTQMNWKKLISEISNFLEDKTFIHSEEIEPFNPNKLRLVVIDFVS